jgi:hypothetical protein
MHGYTLMAHFVNTVGAGTRKECFK